MRNGFVDHSATAEPIGDEREAIAKLVKYSNS